LRGRAERSDPTDAREHVVGEHVKLVEHHLGFQPDGTVDLHQREQRIKEIGAATPVGRVGRPEDVAEVAAFLAGDAADYITGQSINVTGGGVMH
jgi:NAD(P)-dependent dehydrogenase (short-subunit alcohol dehydrogenase family)